MKHVLIVLRTRSPALSSALFARTKDVTWTHADSVDEARRLLQANRYTAVLLEPPVKALSFASFLKFLQGLSPGPRLLSLGQDVAGATRLEPGAPDFVVDQLLDVLGVARSGSLAYETVEVLYEHRPFSLRLVRSPGATAEVVLGGATGRLGEEELQLVQAAMAPRSGEVLEVWWDDPWPYALYLVPAGRSLQRVRATGPLAREAALAVVHAVSKEMASMHAVGLSAGVLDEGRVWLGRDGTVTLPGHGFAQLPPGRSRFVPTPLHAQPPFEPGAPRPTGDAFRLGVLLHSLLGPRPFLKVSHFEFLSGTAPANERVTRALGDAAAFLDEAFDPAPTGALAGEALVEAIGRYAPRDGREVIAQLARA